MNRALGRISLIVLAGALASGCDSLAYMGYLLAPSGGTKKVPAEFEGLSGRTVAVVIYADQGVLFEYPYARLSLSLKIGAELKDKVKKVAVVDPRRVIKYQDENFRWDAMAKNQLGRELNADCVLFVVLEKYTTREPGSVKRCRVVTSSTQPCGGLRGSTCHA